MDGESVSELQEKLCLPIYGRRTKTVTVHWPDRSARVNRTVTYRIRMTIQWFLKRDVLKLAYVSELRDQSYAHQTQSYIRVEHTTEIRHILSCATTGRGKSLPAARRASKV